MNTLGTRTSVVNKQRQVIPAIYFLIKVIIPNSKILYTLCVLELLIMRSVNFDNCCFKRTQG